MGLCSEVLSIPLITCSHIHMFLCAPYLLLLVLLAAQENHTHFLCDHTVSMCDKPIPIVSHFSKRTKQNKTKNDLITD